jgi:RNA polymerase sigma factor (sigma-70 family)
MDSILWSQLKAGDKNALEQIYRDHAAALIKYGRKFSADGQLVEDCLQDLFIELWKNREGLGNTDAIRKYLLVSLRRKIIRALGHSRIAGQEPEEHHFTAVFDIESQLEMEEWDNERRKQLQKALESLSKRQQEVLYLKYFMEMDYAQIGEIMELNYQSARNLAHRALEAIRNLMLLLAWLLPIAALQNFFREM